MEATVIVLVLGMILNGCLAQYPYQQLRQHLLKDYDRFARPVLQASQTVTTEIALSPIYLTLLDEATSSMTMQAWSSLKWKDEFLKWDPSSFSGIKYISIPNNEVWKPDFAIYNSVPIKNVVLMGSTNVLVYSDGSVLWVPAISFETFCSLHTRKDLQKCNITIGSWTESEGFIDFKLAKKSIDTSNFMDNPEWEITGYEAIRQEKHYECCKEAYVSVSFIFDLAMRRSGHVNIKEVMCATTLASIILALAMFWLPSDSEKKFTLGCLSVLILTMLLHLGHTSKSAMATSASFTKIALIVIVIAILIEIVIVNVARMKSPCKAPSFLLSGAVGRVLLLMPAFPKSSTQYQDAEKSGKEALQLKVQEQKEYRSEWGLIATALDRVFFVVFLVIFIVERSI